MCKFIKNLSFVAISIVAMFVVGSKSVMAQGRFVGTSFQGGSYQQIAPNVGHNYFTGSTHVPNVAVTKPSGVYVAIGNGYYQNQMTGNIHNPYTGSYSSGMNIRFKGGSYHDIGPGVRINPLRQSVHLPGRAVYKNSGVYLPIGNGYYENPMTGNVYNPYNGAYKSF